MRFNQRKKIANYPFKGGHLIEANVKSEIIYEKLTWNFHGESQHTFETNWECSWKFTVHQKICIINTNSLLVKICLCMGKHHHHSRSMNLSSIMVWATFLLNSDFNSSFGTLWNPPRGSQRVPGGPREFGEDPFGPKIEKKCSLFSSIFNVEGPFQRYLPKTSWKCMGGWK